MKYPYLPADREIQYVPANHAWMEAARNIAKAESLDLDHPTGAVVVKDDQIIGRGANGSTWHDRYGCARKAQNIPTGEGYELCEGCHPKNHAEQTALSRCKDNAAGADLYLWGHWWCCQSCWSKMTEAGIAQVFLVENATKLFGPSEK